LVQEIVDLLSVEPREFAYVSSIFSGMFNEKLRGHPKTPYAAGKRNDGSFKKWLVQCGFEIGPMFGTPVKNRAIVRIPKGNTKDKSGGAWDTWSAGWQSWESEEGKNASTSWNTCDGTASDLRRLLNLDQGPSATELAPDGPRMEHRSKDSPRNIDEDRLRDSRAEGSRSKGNQRWRKAQDAGVRDASLYIFLDVDAVTHMLKHRSGLFSFQGLLKLCRSGRMVCAPPSIRIIDAAHERERIIFLLVDRVLDDLEGLDNHDEFDEYVEELVDFGILDTVSTKPHTKVLRLGADMERRALDLGIGRRAVMELDFACLWEAQIEEPGRVIFATGGVSICCFGTEAMAAMDRHGSGRRVQVVHIKDMEARFATDHANGGAQLCDIVSKPDTDGSFCDAVLSASVLTSVMNRGLGP